VKFGLQHPSFSFDGHDAQIADSLKQLVLRAESSGFDSFWVMDHFHQIPFVGARDEPMLEGWMTIAAISGITSKIRLGTLVTGNTYRHPSVLAKIGATLDVMSKGRLFMGIGAGWNEEEANAYGIPFPSTKERLKRLEEAVQVIKKMWTEEPANFNGRHYKLQTAHCNPKPIQKPHPPIMVGGEGKRETLRIVAKYANACNLFGSPNTVKHKLNVLREHCKNEGRDYNEILKTKLTTVVIGKRKGEAERRLAELFERAPPERIKEMTIYGTPEEVYHEIKALEDAGVEYLIVNFVAKRESEGVSIFTDEVIKRF
jgi:F420-dependent oxidoreductase-like protein